MSWSRSVFSSNVSEIGFDDEKHELLVTWNSGKVSAYEGVTEEKADEIARAPSVGQALNMEIKPFFRHRYVR